MEVTNEMMHCLRMIQELQFAALELNLFLDNNPGNTKALELFNHLSKELMNHKHHYEEHFGPLLNYGFSPNNSNTWRWVDQPWPWEI